MKRRTFLATGAGLGAALPLAAPAIAQGRVQWNLASSFPLAAPGVGTNVTRYAELVRAMSDGRMEFNLFGAGELVGPFQVEDAVQAGNAPAGHAPPYYSAGREPATHWLTGVPFGMTSAEHVAWLRWGGGQEIWDDIYAERNLKPFYSGNSNTQSGGWFKARIEGVGDLQGLNMRIAGLGAEMMRKLGVNAVLMPAGEIFTALQSGAIDAAEWVGPMLDRAFGLQRITNLCYVPAFAEPAAAVAFSPVLDLTFTGRSWDSNRATDAMLPAERGPDMAAMWLQGADPRDPRASPLFAAWDRPPPVMLCAGRTELLRDDSVRMAERLRAAGGRVALRIAGDLPHVWPYLCPWLPEGCATITEAGAFLADWLQGPAAPAAP